jgi:hypothetical protein
MSNPQAWGSVLISDYDSDSEALRAAEKLVYAEQLARGRLKNRYRIWYGNVVEMQTTLRSQGDRKNPLGNSFYFDLEDLPKVEAGPVWSFNAEGYVVGYITATRYKLRLYRHFLDYDGPLDIDHIDRNRANNRRDNIRICTRRDNLLNRPLYKNNTSGENGISKRKDGSRWTLQWTEDDGQTKTMQFPCTDRGLADAVAAREEIYARIGSTNGQK